MSSCGVKTNPQPSERGSDKELETARCLMVPEWLELRGAGMITSPFTVEDCLFKAAEENVLISNIDSGYKSK
jgi:hypothetical protein